MIIMIATNYTSFTTFSKIFRLLPSPVASVITLTEFMKKLSDQACPQKKPFFFDKLLTTKYFFLLFICTW